MSSSRDDIFTLRLYQQVSFFSTSYLLGSIQVVIPLALVFILVALATIALIAIVIYRRFFLHRKELYGDVKDFFKKNLQMVQNEDQRQNQQQWRNNRKKRNRSINSSPQTLSPAAPTPATRASDTGLMNNSFLASPEEGDDDDDDLLTDLDQVVVEVMSKNKWCCAFENILADNKDNVRNMKALHSILTIPLDFRLTSLLANPDMEKNDALLAVAIRRRQHLHDSGAVPHASRNSHGSRENQLVSQGGTIARAITQRLVELGHKAQHHRLDHSTDANNEATTMNDSFDDNDSYLVTILEEYADQEGRLRHGTLDNLVHNMINPSIADPHYMTAGGGRWKMD